MSPDASEYGDESFTYEKIHGSGLLDDIKALGPDSGQDIRALIEDVMSKASHMMIELWWYVDVTPRRNFTNLFNVELHRWKRSNSKIRKKLSNTIIATMWGSLQHPPQSYLGDESQYRPVDGAYNVMPWPTPLENFTDVGI